MRESSRFPQDTPGGGAKWGDSGHTWVTWGAVSGPGRGMAAREGPTAPTPVRETVPCGGRREGLRTRLCSLFPTLCPAPRCRQGAPPLVARQRAPAPDGRAGRQREGTRAGLQVRSAVNNPGPDRSSL